MATRTRGRQRLPVGYMYGILNQILPSVIPRKNRTANKVLAFVVKAVAMETPDQTRVVQGKYMLGLTRVRSMLEGS